MVNANHASSNSTLVGTLITIGDVTRNIAIAVVERPTGVFKRKSESVRFPNSHAFKTDITDRINAAFFIWKYESWPPDKEPGIADKNVDSSN